VFGELHLLLPKYVEDKNNVPYCSCLEKSEILPFWSDEAKLLGFYKATRNNLCCYKIVEIVCINSVWHTSTLPYLII
jgi:hypothetical protein